MDPIADAQDLGFHDRGVFIAVFRSQHSTIMTGWRGQPT